MNHEKLARGAGRRARSRQGRRVKLIPVLARRRVVPGILGGLASCTRNVCSAIGGCLSASEGVGPAAGGSHRIRSDGVMAPRHDDAGVTDGQSRGWTSAAGARAKFVGGNVLGTCTELPAPHVGGTSANHRLLQAARWQTASVIRCAFTSRTTWFRTRNFQGDDHQSRRVARPDERSTMSLRSA